jgi:hypothetical protein
MAVCEDVIVPKVRRVPGAVGFALTAYDLWRRVPPQQRRMVYRGARRYGPLVAAQMMRSARAAAAARRRGAG